MKRNTIKLLNIFEDSIEENEKENVLTIHLNR